MMATDMASRVSQGNLVLFAICLASLVFECRQSKRICREYFSVNEATCSRHCPSDWASYGNRCFRYIANRTNWISAEKHCLKMDANLVSIHSEHEYQVIKALIRTHDPSENPTWIGLSDCHKVTEWIWSDGTEFNYFKWNPNEPNYLNNDKNWNDIPCREKYPFVCAKKPM
ncbi:C-type lectin lectoxin-Enh4-like isoform X2 [Brachyhypopomus gauderio]|uniref:C-type lectin lectoxin-Enh4-like isoform X2 n=1 Tax=Brachyhypopomus gauderio TaxID=698409 RepID=UPI004042CAFC